MLFNSSFFRPGTDARFLLLTMAIEALIEPAQKSSEAMQLVDGFIEQTKKSAVQRSEKDSLIGSLKWLRDESITKAGQRLERKNGAINAMRVVLPRIISPTFTQSEVGSFTGKCRFRPFRR